VNLSSEIKFISEMLHKILQKIFTRFFRSRSRVDSNKQNRSRGKMKEREKLSLYGNKVIYISYVAMDRKKNVSKRK
jgi:hypothetical protein